MAGTGDILVGVDKSPESRWAVHWATREARLRSATLTLVHVRSTNREG
jgi:nucleotide-binding universal stress UspA family protein